MPSVARGCGACPAPASCGRGACAGWSATSRPCQNLPPWWPTCWRRWTGCALACANEPLKKSHMAAARLTGMARATSCLGTWAAQANTSRADAWGAAYGSLHCARSEGQRSGATCAKRRENEPAQAAPWGEFRHKADRPGNAPERWPRGPRSGIGQRRRIWATMGRHIRILLRGRIPTSGAPAPPSAVAHAPKGLHENERSEVSSLRRKCPSAALRSSASYA